MAKKHTLSISLNDLPMWQKRLADLAQVTETQLMDGTWDYDHYMRGMANGLILACAIMSATDPEYKEAPENGYRADQVG